MLNLCAVAKKHVFGSETKLAGKGCQTYAFWRTSKEKSFCPQRYIFGPKIFIFLQKLAIKYMHCYAFLYFTNQMPILVLS